jgi:zinc/manganese transport system permease protein
MEFMIQPFADFDFMRRALLGCAVVCLGAVPVGTFMMLRRMSLTGDAMAHATLPGAAVAYLYAGLSLPAMALGGFIAGLAVAVCTGAVARNTHIKEDASLAAFYLISLALGVLLLSLKGSNIDLFHVLFGNLLALDNGALYLLATISSITLTVFVLIYRPLVLDSVDPLFLKSVGRAGPLAHYGFLFLMVINLVAGFHAMGTLMAVGVMILPAAAAHFWQRTLGSILTTGLGLALAGAYFGLLLSYYADLAAGPAVILTLGMIYVLSVLFGPVNGMIRRSAFSSPADKSPC